MKSERSSIEDELRKLRAEIASLRKATALSPQFVTWHHKLYELIEAAYGVDSNEMREFRALSPELPSEFYDSVEARLKLVGLNEKFTNALLMKLYKDVPQNVFEQRLHDYDELIATLVFGLSKR